MNKFGYYLFLGRGDHWIGDTPHWTLADWKKNIDFLKNIGMNILFVYMAGHMLPYKSRFYPEITEKDNENVKRDFFQKIIDYANSKGIEIVACLTTTGHSAGFWNLNRELSVRKYHGAYLDFGKLCPDHQKSRQYPHNLLTETLARYKGFSGIIFHPPEFTPFCFCGKTREEYRKATGRNLENENELTIMRWNISKNLELIKDLFEKAEKIDPYLKHYLFTCDYLENEIDLVKKYINKTTTIMYWNYDTSEKGIKNLAPSIKKWQALGNDIWFMPSYHGAYATNHRGNYAKSVKKQVFISGKNGINNIVYFVGTIWDKKEIKRTLPQNFNTR